MTAPTAQVVFVTPSLPLSAPLHAGGLLQRDVTASLIEQGAQVVVIAPAFRSSLEVLSEVVPGCTVVLPEQLLRRGSPRGMLVRLAHRLNGRAGRSLLQTAHPPFLLALLLQPRCWRLLRSASVIDLQWFSSIRLRPLIRLIAGRGPRLVGTFHDVVSQRLQRAAAVEIDPGRRRRLRAAVGRARRRERRLGGRLDESVVLSGKDRGLLVAAGVPGRRVRVLAPLVQAPVGPRPPREDPAPTLVFVGYLLRLENHEAALWLLREIWPRVLQELPGARLRIVGGGAKPALEEEVERSGGSAVLAGFVADLWAEYRRADCSVVPLRDGAGVKFKTIESLLAGVPTVATPIGAEGVGTLADFVVVSEDPAVLAAGIVRALREESERTRAQRTGARLRDQHGRDAFDRTIAAIYRL